MAEVAADCARGPDVLLRTLRLGCSEADTIDALRVCWYGSDHRPITAVVACCSCRSGESDGWWLMPSGSDCADSGVAWVPQLGRVGTPGTAPGDPECITGDC